MAAYKRGDYQIALRLWRPLAEKGDAGAQTNLGVMYDTGEGVPQDHAQAAAWFRKAANQGVAQAEFDLGLKYDNGEGVPPDQAEALIWYRKAADQGWGKAQYHLGVAYAYGHGVPEDYVLAYMWLNLAASHEKSGGDFAAKVRDALADKMTGAQIAEAQRMAREWKPKASAQPVP